jgi:membrane protein DedA with SNARE-associated domain
MVFYLDQITTLISQYGYIAIFILMFLESVILPIPSEVVLPFAGAMIGAGLLSPFVAFPVAVLASVLGNFVGFIIGYILGIDVIFKYGKRLGFNMKNYTKGESWIKKYGILFAFISKLLPAVRSISSIICGAFKMDTKKFLAYTTLGVIIWSAVLMYAGYVLESHWNNIASAISGSSIYVVVGALVVLVLIIRKTIIKVINRVLSKILRVL